MANTDLFAATTMQLNRDRSRTTVVALSLALLLAAAWLVWLCFSHVTVYASTDQARVEVAQAVYFVQSSVAGRVIKSNLELGKQVDTGTVLVEIEADQQNLRVQEEQTHRDTLRAQLDELQQELVAQQRSMDAEHSATGYATQEVRAKFDQAQVAAKFSAEDLRRKELLFKQGLMSEIDFLRAQSEKKQKDAELHSLETAVGESEGQRVIKGSEREAHIEEIKTEIRRVQGEIAGSENTIQQLQHELGGHHIVAPGRGHLGSIAALKPGSYIREGDRLAAIIPDGAFHIVAEFEPQNAIGRVHPGQTGRLRLDGFSWAEYGALKATVTRVGSEVRDGRVRVELQPTLNPRLPLQHGMPGTLQIAIERVSPAALLLRKAGGYMAHPPATPQAAPQVAER